MDQGFDLPLSEGAKETQLNTGKSTHRQQGSIPTGVTMLEHFFNPKSVAVVGASHKEGSVGNDIFQNMVNNGYAGEVYGINPKGGELMGRALYPTLTAVGKPIDLVIIVIPGKAVAGIMHECGQLGIDSVIIISAGFKETGSEGAQLERELGVIAQQYGIRVVGPNCLGIVVPKIGLSASFAPGMPRAGNIAMMSQSGALATAVLDWAFAQGMGFSKFVSFGNAMDVGTNDLLKAWADDPDTHVIVAYLEGVKNGQEFMAIAREVAKKKPLIVVKSGSTSAGARAVSSHTGSLAGAEQAYDAAFRQSGVLRATSVDQLYDLASAFSALRMPKGRNVVFITNAGGPGIMATDAAEKLGLKMATLSKETVEKLRTKLPPASNFYNPVDVLGDAQPDRYQFAAETLLSDPAVENIVFLVTPQTVTDIVGTAQAIADTAKRSAIPVIGCMMGEQEMQKGWKVLRENGVPSYGFPERAVGALQAVCRYKEWLEKPEDKICKFDVNKAKVAEIFAAARKQERFNLGEVEAREIVTAYGFRIPKGGLAKTAAEAAEMAAGVGFPVVMKIASPDILHKSDIGGVKVGVASREQAVEVFEQMIIAARRFMPEADIWGVSVQEMITTGKEVILGMNRDPQFGPLLMFGLGGIYVEVLKDVAFRVAPLGEAETRAMIQEIRGYPLLAGVRGDKPADIDAIVDAVQRLSQLVTDFPEIVEMDINPLKVQEAGAGAIAIDARFSIV
jgi:acetate---CoA ligase (ADP-forming)